MTFMIALNYFMIRRSWWALWSLIPYLMTPDGHSGLRGRRELFQDQKVTIIFMVGLT